MSHVRTPVLITGAAGFVGSNILRRLARDVDPRRIHILLRKDSNNWRINDLLEKKRITVYIPDLRVPQNASVLMRAAKPKTVFHMATHGAYPKEQHHEQEIIDTNIVCTFNLMQAALAAGVEAFVNTGTSSEYGTKQKPMRESDVLEPNTAYGASKAWASIYGQYLARATLAPITTLRLFSVYGPYEPYEPMGRLVPNLIMSFLAGKQPTLTAPGTVRDFIFVDDVVDACLAAAARPSAGTIFNVGTGVQTTLAEVARTLAGIMGVAIRPRINRATARSFDTRRWVADIAFAREKLKWKPRITTEEGLRRTAQWFTKNLSLYEQ